MAFRVAIDNGGTFTDGVLIGENGDVITSKVHTTPQDPTQGTLNCIANLASALDMDLSDLLAQTDTILHGTTLATNVVATRSGAKMGTIATKGYRLRMTFPQVPKSDWKECQADMYDFRLNEPKALTRNYLMTEVEERVNYRGEVLTPLDEESVRTAVRYLKEQRVESIAVMLMFSPIYPHHEQRVAKIIEEEYPGVHVALSSKVLPTLGEIDRWSTTMFSAYVAPAVTSYVSNIQSILKQKGLKGGLLFMQSNGGVATQDVIMENPAMLLFSGPAAGPAVGVSLGSDHGFKNVISIDMGGTSFDVGVASEGTVDTVQLKVIEAKKYALPSVDVTTVGAGGGSIAYVDLIGRLHVGPQSAGAVPGPACYGQGGEEPTVTDADVILGYLDPDYFLGGEVKLKKELAEKAIKEKIADPLGLSVQEAAAAIYEVTNTNMAGAMDVVFAKRGYDPREFALCAAGGAAPVHAVRLMEELGIKRLIIPKIAPVYCSFGMLRCDLKHDFQRPYLSETAKADLDRINELYKEMEREAVDVLQKERVAEKDVIIEKTMELHYYGQFRPRIADVPIGPVTQESLAATIENFHEVHKNTVGYADPNYPTVIGRLLLSGVAKITKPQPKAIPQGTGDPSKALKGTRQAYFGEHGVVSTNVYDGDKLLAGDQLTGPCIIEERFTTLVVPPNVFAEADSGGNYVITV